MSRSPLDIVCDAGPLIHLDELGCLDLLTDFRAVLVPKQVWREVEHHRPDALECPGVEIQQVPVILSEDASFNMGGIGPMSSQPFPGERGEQ